MRLLIPLKYKIIFPALVGVIGTGFLFRALTIKKLDEDRTYFGLEVAQNVGESVRGEIETLIKFRLLELERLTVAANAYDEKRIFETASSDFAKDIVGITFFTPKEDGTYSMRFATNYKLLQSAHLPKNTLFLMNQANPLDINQLSEKHRTAVLNRSFVLPGGEAVGIQSFVLYGKSLDGSPQGTVVLADALADSINARLGRSKQVQSFLVSKTGALIAHAEAQTLNEFKNKPYPGFPKTLLPEDWTKGTRFSWDFEGKSLLTLVTPTGLPDVYLCSEVEKTPFAQTMASLEKDFLMSAWAILGACILMALWVASRMVRNIRNTAAVAECLVQGDFERVPRIRTFDEFRYVRETFERMIPGLKEKFQSEFERGKNDANLANTQALRALMSNPTPHAFEGWELVTHRPNTTMSHQDFWDFYQLGSRRQVLVGRCNVEGVSGSLLALMVQSTLESTRKLSSRFSTQRALTLVEVLDILNSTIYNAFKGRVFLQATAFEFDVDSGAMTWVNMGGALPLRWRPEGHSTGIDDKSLALESGPLGANAVATFQPMTSVIAPGERVFVHTASVLSAGAREDVPHATLTQTIFAQGQKPLAEIKTSILAAAEGRSFHNSLVFVALRRLGMENAEPRTLKAA